MYGIIYKITNITNNKVYIGQTNRTFEERIKEHKSHYKRQRFAIECAFYKYGINNFSFEIIDEGNSQEDLNDKEKKYVKIYNSNSKKFGYNELEGGKNSKHSQSTKDKISKALKGVKRPWITERNNLYWTEGRKKEFSLQRKGIISCNKEQLRKLSEAKKGKRIKHLEHNIIKIMCLNNNKIYNSCLEACKDLNLSSGNLSKVINGIYPHTKGYKFEKII